MTKSDESGMEMKRGAGETDFKPYTLRRSFLNAMRHLKVHVASKYYRTNVPWFMIVGETESGKTSILEHTGLDYAIIEPDGVGTSQQGLNWHFFDKGVVLDVPGRYVLRSDAGPTDEKGWQTLLKLTQRQRSDCPLNGIVITVPCPDLIGSSSQLSDRLIVAREKASQLYDKLWKAERILGMCVPVYILVTKCDHITGFDSFCREVTEEHHGEMFGWSSPYNINTAFQPHWVDGAFQSTLSDLAELQFEIYAERKNVSDFDEVFRLPLEFQQMKETLKVFLTHLFRKTAYHEAFFLRGIYFCGDKLTAACSNPTRPVDLTMPKLEQNEDSIQDIEKVSIEPADAENEVVESSDHPPVPAQETSRHPVFTANLFEQKIFQESDLARPVSKTFLSKNRGTRVAQFVSIALFFVFSLGLTLAYYRLNAEEIQLYTLLNNVKTDLDEVKEIIDRNGGKDDVLKNNTNQILGAMDNVSSWPFIFLAIPSSWFSEIKSNIQDSMKNAFEFVVLGSLRLSLENRIKAVFDKQAEPDHNIMDSVSELRDLHKNSTMYNKISKPGHGDLEDLDNVLSYLGYAPMPGSLEDINALFKEAFQQADGESLVVAPLYRDGPLMVAQRFDAVVESVLASDGTLPEALLLDISRSQEVLKDPELTWISKSSFPIGSPFEGMAIGDAFGPINLVLEWLRTSSAIIALGGDTTAVRVQMGEKLLWDRSYLQQAVNEYTTYQDFTKVQLSELPENMRVRVESFARERLERTMIHLVKKAQRIERVPQWSLDSRLEKELLPQVKSLTEAETLLLKLQDIPDDLILTEAKQAYDLNYHVEFQAHYLLEELENELHRAQLYRVKNGDFSWWNGHDKLVEEAYGVDGPEELEELLAFQRQRISFMARECAFPVIAFLSARAVDTTSHQANLFNKWQSIIQDLNDYVNKKPGKSLSRLESFIRLDLNQVTPDNYRDFGTGIPRTTRKPDYFQQTYENMFRALSKRCEALAEEATLAHYRECVDYFNANIRGRFPFTNTPITSGMVELEPEILYNFYAIFDRRWGPTRDVLLRWVDDPQKRSAAMLSAISFMEQMAALRPLSAPFLPKKNLPFYDFDISFRVNRELEKGAKNIIDWTLYVDNEPITNHDTVTKGRWSFGQDVRMSFRWAKNAPIIPLSDPAWPNLVVAQGHANFEYSNEWGLLGLIKMHKGAASDFARAVDPRPNTLKFQIDTRHRTQEAKDQATVFVRISLMFPGKQEALTVTDFPVEAPAL